MIFKTKYRINLTGLNIRLDESISYKVNNRENPVL